MSTNNFSYENICVVVDYTELSLGGKTVFTEEDLE